MTSAKERCRQCGHERARHVLDNEGQPYGLIDNIDGRGMIYCDVADPFHSPPWVSCGCDGWAGPVGLETA